MTAGDAALAGDQSQSLMSMATLDLIQHCKECHTAKHVQPGAILAGANVCLSDGAENATPMAKSEKIWQLLCAEIQNPSK